MSEESVGDAGASSLGYFGGCFSPDGRSIVAHGFTGALHLWNREGLHSTMPDTMRGATQWDGNYQLTSDSCTSSPLFLVGAKTPCTTMAQLSHCLSADKQPKLWRDGWCDATAVCTCIDFLLLAVCLIMSHVTQGKATVDGCCGMRWAGNLAQWLTWVGC